MIPARFESASGLRLSAAFLLIIGVLAVVALKASKVTLWDKGEQPRNLKEQRGSEIAFDLVDRSGVPLALSVERMEFVAYPNALWQAHTPDQLLPRLSSALGWKLEELSAALLPPLKNGWFEIQEPPFELDAAEAQSLAGWIARGSTDEEAAANPIPGFQLRPAAGGRVHLWWQPLVVLSREVRERHGANSTVRWSRKLADDLIHCVFGAQGKKLLEQSEDELKAARKLVWDALLPLHFKRVMKEVPPQISVKVYQLLKDERVREHQAKLLPVNKRVYPVRDGASEDAAPPLSVLGSWGMLNVEAARERARGELHLEADQALDPQDQLELEARELLRRSYPSPVCGLELAGYQLLQRPEFDWIERNPERYWFLASYVPRRAPMRYFQADDTGDPTPRIVTTLDASLQRHVRSVLEQVMLQHKPALAMAIAIDVATGNVLAVDSVDAYEASGFLPTVHTYTPGSTMKVIVMATAVDTDSVSLTDTFDTHNGHFVLDGKREIHEAEGAQTGRLTPAMGLAYSCNAVLVQIGLQIPAQLLFERFQQLGYGRAPGAGLGPERAGLIPGWPWDRRFKHASVCIGHQMQVTLWQQAAALATVVRGGNFLPLRLFGAVEQGARHEELPAPGPGLAVFKPQTCGIVREMMKLGATLGTGSKVSCPDFEMGTKTGTAQKVGTEVCLHAEMAYNRDRAKGVGPELSRAQLRERKPHGGYCYTCSMCAWGHLPDSPREVLVYVVVDEPRGIRHYGSEIAGPAAMSILKEAIGYTHGGVRVKDAPHPGFAPLEKLAQTAGGAAPKNGIESRARTLPLQPWREAGHALR